MNTNTSSEELTIEINNNSSSEASPVCARNYRRIMNVSEDSDDGSLENVGNLPFRRSKSCRGNYCKTSLDKKDILIKCYVEGKTIAESAQIAGINKNTATSVIARYKKDGCEIVRRNRGGKRNGKLSDEILRYVEQMIEENPSITLKNMKLKIFENKNINMTTTSVFNALKALKITLKTATINLDRLNSTSTIEQRKNYAINFSQNAPQTRENIIFIDESGFNCHLRRNKARSRINTPAHVIVPTVRGRNVSLIAAMNLHGIVHTEVISNSSVNSNIFIRFLDGLFHKLAEENIEEAWLVLDNAKIHKTQEVRDKVNEARHRLIFLSPYSPMLNPIEKVFSKIKLSARNILAEPENNLNLVNIIETSVATVTSADCNNYYVDMSMKLPLAVAGQPLH